MIKHAVALDNAFDLFMFIKNDEELFTTKPAYVPGGEQPLKPIDAAANMVKSLLPLVYNYSPLAKDLTDAIWCEMIEKQQVIPLENARYVTNSLRGTQCNVCGNDERSYQHYIECLA